MTRSQSRHRYGLAAAGVLGAAALGMAGVQLSHNGTAHADGSVTATTPFAPTTIRQGPGDNYPSAGMTPSLHQYVLMCHSGNAAQLPPGVAGPQQVPTDLWYRIAETATPSTPVGYLRPDQLNLPSGFVWSQLPACAATQPAVTDPNAPAVTAPRPLKCQSGVLNVGLNPGITVHTSSGHLDIVFTPAAVAASIDVEDTSTDVTKSGTALRDAKATWHFTEDEKTTFGDHTLNIKAEGALGGPTGESVEGNPMGELVDGAVSWENLSDNCIP